MRWLKRLLLNTFYVRLGPDRLAIDEIGSGQQLSDVPVLAVNAETKILAVGREAEAAAAADRALRLIYPFRHPRTLIGDFTAAEKVLLHFLRSVRRRLPPKPMALTIIQPVPAIDGGLTQAERRALLELGQNAGSARCYVHEGPELPPSAITSEFIEKLSTRL